jgi:hypothetical protein
VSWLSPAALCRLDGALLESLRRAKGLPAVARSAVVAILVGGGAYGVAFGAWRAPAQALYSAVKLPVLFLAVALCTAGLGGMLALLLRSRLTLEQTGVCMLLSFAVTATVLAALSPVAIAIDLLVPPPDPGLLGFEQTDPRLFDAHSVGSALLLMHTALVAAAGTTGVARLHTLLLGLGLERSVARRVLSSWIAAQFCAGSQLCWLLRPFFGAAEVTPSFLPAHALRGNFFEAVAALMNTTFGPMAPLALVCAGLAAVGILAQSLHGGPTWVAFEVDSTGLWIVGAERRLVAWNDVTSAMAEGADVTVDLAANETLGTERWRMACESGADAQALSRRITTARCGVEAGPFRTLAPRS